MAVLAPSGLSANPTGPNSIELIWTNNAADYDYVSVERGSTEIVQTGYGVDRCTDTDVDDGTAYTYRVRAYLDGDGWSDYSSTAPATTELAAPSGLSGSASGTTITLEWDDNSKSETGFQIWRSTGGAYTSLTTVLADIETYANSGLTAGNTYSYKIRAYGAAGLLSAWAGPISVKVTAPPDAPSNLQAISYAANEIRLSWRDNSSNETGFHIAANNGAAVANVSADVTHYNKAGLAAATQYGFKVQAYNTTTGNSAYTPVVYATTGNTLSQPSNLSVFAYSDNVIEVTFDDTSANEDDHRIERSTDGNNFTEVKTLVPNVTYWKDTGRTVNTQYWYKVRAKQGGDYSAYSDTANTTTYPNTPGVPSNLAISDLQNTKLRLNWTAVNDAQVAGYRIFQSTDGANYTNVFSTRSYGINNCEVSGLSASTLYYFKVCSYGINGNSANTAAANDTTLAAYLQSDFERFLMMGTSTPVYLLELKTRAVVTGWANIAGTNNTYGVTLDEPLIDVVGVYEAGNAYAENTGANLDAANSQFSFDFYTRNLCIKTSTGSDPSNEFPASIQAEFRHRFTNVQSGNTIFDDHHYLGLLNSSLIPELGQEISPFYEGSIINQGWTVGILNGKVMGEPFWDKRYARYNLIGSTAVLRVGSESMNNYADFKPVASGRVYGALCTDSQIELDIRDLREDLSGPVPCNRFIKKLYPNIADTEIDRVIPAGFGVIPGASPVCIDNTNKRWKFQDGRAYSVEAVRINANAQVENTNYYVDYKNGVITFAAATTVDANNDVVEVDYSGYVGKAGGLIGTGPQILKHVLNEWRGLNDTDIDLDSFYSANNSAAAISVYLNSEIDFGGFLNRLEHSMRAAILQSGDGRIMIQTIKTTAPSGIRYLRTGHITNYSQSRSRESVYRDVKLYYGYCANNDAWSYVSAGNNQAEWKYGCYDTLELYSYANNATGALTLASAYKDDLEKDYIEFDGPMTLLNHLPGDLFYLKRTRFYSTQGTAWRKLCRIIGIQKNIAERRVKVKAEVV